MRKGQVSTFALLMMMFMSFMIGVFLQYKSDKDLPNYKQGQVDCLNGIIKYELKQQANGEKVWQEKK